VLCAALAGPAFAAEKPEPSPDPPSPFVTSSRISAKVEFGLPALARAIERDIPRRLATFDERIECVHRRVLFFRVKANCDIQGYIERTGPVSLYGRGDRVIGAVSIFGTVEGQGANRFTSRIHGEAEARATVEAEARPRLLRDWALELNVSDGLHWSEPPILHVLGREIPLARCVEPRVRAELGMVRARARTAAAALDLRDKAASAWRQAFEPIEISTDPVIWLQMKPRAIAFAGVRADSRVLAGSLELTADVESFVGQAPAAAAPTPLPPLGGEVAAPGAFDIIAPVHIGYDVLRDAIQRAVDAAPKGEMALREVQIYPSAGKIVVGLRIAKSSDADPGAGSWVYLSGAPRVDLEKELIELSDLVAPAGDAGAPAIDDPLLATLRQKVSVSYRDARQKLFDAVNQRLTRPLKNGFRMEGHVAAAHLDKTLLLADGISLALHASGELKLLYGL
jgi:hypothetical protein